MDWNVNNCDENNHNYYIEVCTKFYIYVYRWVDISVTRLWEQSLILILNIHSNTKLKCLYLRDLLDLIDEIHQNDRLILNINFQA